MNDAKRWRKKQALAAPCRYYGDGGTIHDGGYLDVQIVDGQIVAVMFRCQPLPFRQWDLDAPYDTTAMPALPILTGVEVLDPVEPGKAK